MSRNQLALTLVTAVKLSGAAISTIEVEVHQPAVAKKPSIAVLTLNAATQIRRTSHTKPLRAALVAESQQRFVSIASSRSFTAVSYISRR